MTRTATTALRAAIVATALAGAATLALAADEPAGQPAAVEAEITISELVARLEAEGYADIREIEREGRLYEVEARDAKGNEVEIMVSLDGEILSVEQE